MKLSEINLNDLDIDDLKKIGSAPLAVKITIIVILCIGLATAGYFLDTTKQKVELEKVAAEEQQLRTVFSDKQAKAAKVSSQKVAADCPYRGLCHKSP